MLEFESGLRHVEDTEILIVYNMCHEAMEILVSDEDNPLPFDDNGMEPDGQAWYIPLNEISEEVVDQLGIHRLGRESSAHVIVGYEGTPEQKRELSERFGFRWCGYTSREVVYARDAE